MQDGKGLSLPSWDKLFAGRQSTLHPDHTTSRVDAAKAVPVRETPTTDRDVEVTKVVCSGQEQDHVETELEGAFLESMPGIVQAPKAAHLSDASQAIQQSSQNSYGNAPFPEVIRKTYDRSSRRSRSSVSTTEVAVEASGSTPRKAAAPSKPTEAHTLQQAFAHQAQPTRRDVGASGLLEQTPDARTSAQVGDLAHHNIAQRGKQPHLDGPLPVTVDEADLWTTFTSLFGMGGNADHAVEESNTEGFLGAISTLQTLLGGSGSGKSEMHFSAEQKGDVERALRLSSKTDASSTVPTAESDPGDDSNTGIRHQPTYLSPRLPIVFAHGLFGFDEFSLAPSSLRASLPSLSFVYWRGIADTLKRRGVEVLVAKVPMSASIEERATALRDLIETEFPHREINLIGHSMGGLDGRFLASRLESTFTVRSLTTIATPHRGSTFADYMLYKVIGQERLPQLLKLVESAGIAGGGRAFECLTIAQMQHFNETVPDHREVTYMSWGAACQPGFFHEFRIPYGIIKEAEGDNDGLVSVESSKWGEYMGTLRASHLDLIGWTNRLASLTASLGPKEKPFDPKALYLTICEDLAKRGL